MLGSPSPSRLRGPSTWLACAALLLAVLALASCGATSKTAGDTSTTSNTPGTSGASTPSTVPGSADAPTQTPPKPTATPTHSSSSAPTATPTMPIIVCCVHIAPTIHQVVAQQTLSGTSVGPVSASCPSGEVALSGGWATSPSDGSNPTVYNATRNGTGSWNVYVNHSGSTLVNAYVECLQNASGATIAERWAGGLTVPANSYATKYASCNSGEVLVGGGFATNNSLTLYNFTASGSSWGGYVWNHTGSSSSASFYAECLTYSGASSTFTAPAIGHSSGATASCPSGSAVSGGGFAAGNSSSPIFTMSANGNGWQAYVTPSSTTLNVYAECVKFS